MQLLSQPGGAVLVAQAPCWESESSTLDGRDHLLLGRMPKDISRSSEQGLSWYLGQLYGVVCPGLIFAQHLFEGLRRDMRVDVDGNAAKLKLAATWVQPRDARLIGNDQFNMDLEFFPAEPDRVFCVYISRNRMLKEFPHIYGWLEHWTWISADPARPGAPIEWETRYDKEIWSATR